MDEASTVFDRLPFASYAAFLEGHRQKQYQVAVRFDPRSLAWFDDVSCRVVFGLGAFCPLIVAACVAFLAVWKREPWLWAAVAMFVYDFLIASGYLTLVRCFYWIVFILLAFPIGWYAPRVGLTMIQYAPWLMITQVISSASKGVVHIRVEEAVRESEASFVWFFSRGIISVVEMPANRWYRHNGAFTPRQPIE